MLHSYDWSETSLIVELFTRERGRLVVAAKGAKRAHSNFRPVLLPFQPLHILLGKAPADERAEVHNLRSAEWAGGRPLLPPAALLSGFYLNELLLKLLARQDPHAALFDAYADSVAALAGAAEEAVTLRAFELILLRELGVLPDLALATASAQALHSERGYTLQPEAGLVSVQPEAGLVSVQPELGLVSAVQGLPGATWVGIEAALRHGSVAAVRQACDGGAAALRAPLRELLDYHLGSARLRTRQVWQAVQKLASSARTSPP